ncbi:MAG: translation initiation factor [bacterium]|nr:translation initiation factor [bacterium]
MKNTKLVYSTDPEKNRTCPKCGEFVNACRCVSEGAVKYSDITAVMRIEKSGRKGKTVTVIDRLPKNEQFLKDMTKKLKTQCGSGGTYKKDGKDGIIEIQGDNRNSIRKILEKEGVKCKG